MSAQEGRLLVPAEREGAVVGYLQYDCESAEPELHRIYVDPDLKRGGIGSALMQALHERLPGGSSYILLVAEANTDAQAFYVRHGLSVERRIDGNAHSSDAMDMELDAPPRSTHGVLMRFTNVNRQPGTT